MASTSKDIDQTLYSKPDNSRKIPELRDMKDNTTNKQLDNREQHNELLENILDTSKNKEFSCSNSSNYDDPALLKDDLPEFSDSRLRLNKVIGFATNASIEKLNDSNKNVHDIAKEIFEEITRQNTNQAICQKMLKGINMDEIDVNHVKKVIESIHGTKNIEPIQHPPLPPTNLLDLGLTRVLISPVEANVENDLSKTPEQQHYSTQVSSKLPSIREKLNSDINVLHKIGPSSKIESKPKQTFISALKPGTLIDLENSKVTRTSLHIESLRPSVNLNEKNSDIKSLCVKSGIKLIENITDGKCVPDVALRDPRIRNKNSKNPENVNLTPLPIQANAQQLTCAPLIPSVQSSNPNNSSHFPPDKSFLKSTSFESKALEMTPPLAPMNNYLDNSSQKEMSVYNEPSNVRSPHINMQPFQKQFSTKFNRNSNPLQFNSCSSLTLSQNKHRNDFIVDKQTNDFRHHTSHSNQTHVNPISQNEIIRHREPVSFKSHSVARRDPRSISYEKKMNEPRSYKEYREAKYGRDKNSYRGYSLNSKMNQNHERDRHRTSTRDEDKWKDTLKSDSRNSNVYQNLGVINDSAFNKSFKIPKIKRDDETIDKNITSKELKTKKDTTTETIKDNHTKKDMIIALHKDKNVDKDMKSEIVKDNIKCYSNKIEEDSEVVKHIANNSISSINEVDKSIENHTSNELKIETSKHKKPKKYSNEKEFEKIVKEAVESLNDDISGPRTRTRSSLKKKEKETLKKLNSDDSSKTDYVKKITLEECSKNINPSLLQDLKDVDASIEIGHNVISSTSKEISEVDCSAETIIVSHQENMVSSNEINSTADTPSNPKIDEKVLNTLLANPKLISLLQDNEKLEKLHKLLENPVVENINENKSTNQNISNENIDIYSEENDYKRMKKREKRKRKRQLKLKTKCEESFDVSKNIAHVNAISNDDILDQEENTETVKDETNGLNSLKSVRNPSSISNFSDLSTNQFKLKSNKRTKYKPQYEIRKDENFKMVISKFNKNSKTIENSGLKNSVPATNKRKMKAKDEELQIVKPKKPFLGPLSVKLARLKMATEQENSQKLDEKTQLEFEIDSENNVKHGSKSNQLNENVNSNEIKSLNNEPPFVLLKSIEGNSIKNVTSSTTSTVPSEATHFQDKSTISEQNLNKITLSNTNIIDNKLEVKKHRPKMTELDKLHADINENCAAVLSVPCVRQCRTNKQVNYVNSNNVIFPKKNKNSNVEQLNMCDKLTSGVENSKATKKLSNKFKKNKQNVKKSGIKKMCSPKTAKNVVIDKKHKVSQSCKLNKLKSSKQKKKSSLNLTPIQSCEELNLNKEISHEINTVVSPKVLTNNEFKDKFYFQSTDDSVECKFCCYNDKGINIVRHYVEQHHNEEVLPSRLSKDCAEVLISESIHENYTFINVDQFEDSKSGHLPVTVQLMCVFCKMVFLNIIEFFDHITCHTGEYRYKCKMCEQIFSDENELKKHISVHSTYDKTDGISFLLLPNPIQSNKLFGYLCPFCYYIQLDYINMVKHMTLRHFDEDKKCNGHWTIIRVNMSFKDNSFIDSAIDYNNLVGCLPPVQYERYAHQTISKDMNLDVQLQPISISEPIVHSKNNLKVTLEPIKKEICEQETLEDLSRPTISQPSSKLLNSLCISESNTLQLLSKQSNSPCKLESITHKLSPKHMNSPCMMESDLHMLSLKQTDPLCMIESDVHLLSPNQTNPPCMIESDVHLLSLKQTDPPCKSKAIVHTLSPKHINSLCMPESNFILLLPKQTDPPCMPESNLLQLSPKHINHPSMLETNLLQPSSEQTNPTCMFKSNNMLQSSPNLENSCKVKSEILELSSIQESIQSKLISINVILYLIKL